ncbi:insulinase family protein [bacterium]|nr:insulinase family protein [bacterium]
MATTLFDTSLSNGLKVLIVTDPSSPLAAARTYVRAGAISEEDCLGQGISHFLEHLVAGGPTRFRTEDDYKRLLSMLGGGYNAYTTTDHTCYYINTIPENTEEAIRILSEWMFYNTFGTTEFEREREVITREIEKNSAELGRVFYQLCQTQFYHNTPMRYPVIGYIENFRNTTIQQLKRYYQRYYIPSNMILVVGSPLAPEAVMPWVEAAFGRAPMSAPPTTVITPEPRPFSPRQVVKEWDTATTYYSIRFSTVDLFSKDLYALDVLDFMLTNGEDSLLVHDIVDDKKWAYSVGSSSYTPSVTTGYFDFTFELDDADIPKVRDRLFAHLTAIKNGDIDPERIQRAKKQKLAEDAFAIATIEDSVSRFGQGYLYAQTPHFYDDYAAQFREVTVDDVIRVARTYFDYSRIVECRLIPRIKVEPVTRPSIWVPSVPMPERHVFPNGMRVITYKESSYPRVIAKTFFDGGVRRETPEINGIGTMMADMMATGTSTLSKRDIAKQVEDRGADISAGIGNNTFYVTMECMTEDVADMFRLYVTTMIDARFDERELSESRRQVLQWISQRKDDWYRYAVYQFRKSFFGSHPYGMPLNGERQPIQSFTTDQIDAYYRSHWCPESMVMVVVGDVDAAQVLDWAAPLGQIPATGTPLLTPTRTVHTTPSHHRLTVEQDVAAVFIAFDGERLTQSKDAMRLDLLNTVLSGMNYPAGRLHNLLRDEGLVYLVHGANYLGIEPGYMLFYALTSPQHQQRVHDVMTRQVESVKTLPISTDEFEQALAQMRFFFKERVASLDSLATIVAIDELLGRGCEYFSTVHDEIAKLTISDVKDYAQRYLVHPQEYWFNQGKSS